MEKAVLITGASGGSGLRIAQEFASHGYAVFVTSREGEKAAASAKLLAETYGVFAKGYALGTEEEAEVLEIFSDIRNEGYLLDAAVLNSADLGIGMDPLTVPLEDWMRVIRTNLGWNFSIARQAAMQMKQKDGGAIVFTSSNTSRRAIKNRSAYIASKGGLISLAKALAVDLGEYHIRVNCLLPGSIKTVRWDACDPETQESRKARVPLKEIADFDDLANAAYFLATEASKNITGTELVIDGGVDAQLFPG